MLGLGDHFSNLTLCVDSACMKSSKPASESPNSEKEWQKTQYSNLIRYVPSGRYFARLRVRGKLIRQSLKTYVFSVAKLRLANLEKGEHESAESDEAAFKRSITFGSMYLTQTRPHVGIADGLVNQMLRFSTENLRAAAA